MNNIEPFIEFLNFIGEFRKIKRLVFLKAEEKFENDAEHSFELAMAAWFIINKEKLSLDAHKAIQYALVHDLVEVFSGDHDPYNSPLTPEQKQQNEHESLDHLSKKFNHFPQLATTISDYEKKNDPESKFVYALDKILPVLHVYIEKSDFYDERGVTFEKWLSYTKPRIAVSKELQLYYEELERLVKDSWIFSQTKNNPE